VHLSLEDVDDRDMIIDGLVSGVESITVDLSDEVLQIERAALGYLRHFPALKHITCALGSGDTSLSPFIPPSLEALWLDCTACSEPLQLLGCLPPMIESSQAKLRSAPVHREPSREGTRCEESPPGLCAHARGGASDSFRRIRVVS
jgi:hypothetical protein